MLADGGAPHCSRPGPGKKKIDALAVTPHHSQGFAWPSGFAWTSGRDLIVCPPANSQTACLPGCLPGVHRRGPFLLLPPLVGATRGTTQPISAPHATSPKNRCPGCAFLDNQPDAANDGTHTCLAMQPLLHYCIADNYTPLPLAVVWYGFVEMSFTPLPNSLWQFN